MDNSPAHFICRHQTTNLIYFKMCIFTFILLLSFCISFAPAPSHRRMSWVIFHCLLWEKLLAPFKTAIWHFVLVSVWIMMVCLCFTSGTFSLSRYEIDRVNREKKREKILKICISKDLSAVGKRDFFLHRFSARFTKEISKNLYQMFFSFIFRFHLWTWSKVKLTLAFALLVQCVAAGSTEYFKCSSETLVIVKNRVSRVRMDFPKSSVEQKKKCETKKWGGKNCVYKSVIK